jgi:hypothetical protein
MPKSTEPEPTELASLPMHTLRELRNVTIDVARRIDALLAHLEDEQGYAELRLVVKRGVPTQLFVERSFKLG